MDLAKNGNMETAPWRRAWGSAKGAWGWGRWTLFCLAAAAIWWNPSSGLTDALLVAFGLAALARPGRVWRTWGNPAGVAFLFLGVWALASAGWSVEPSDVGRDCAKQLPLVLGTMGLATWLRGNAGLVVRRAALVSAAAVTVRLVAEGAALLHLCGWPGVLSQARYVDTAAHPYLYTHPNVSSMLGGMAFLVFLAFLPALWRKGRGGFAAGLAAMALDAAYIVMMGSRGPQMALAAAALLLPIFWVPGWKLRLATLLAVVLAGTALVHVAARINPRFADAASMRGANHRDIIWNHLSGFHQIRPWTGFAPATPSMMALRPWTGYGFGKKAFHRMVYENPSQRAPRGVEFEFPHAHSYWLMLAVQGGRVALAAGVVAWGALAFGLLLALKRLPPRPMAARATPALLLTLLAMTLGYGVADYPDSVLRVAQFLVVAAAMACMAEASSAQGQEDAAP